MAVKREAIVEMNEQMLAPGLHVGDGRADETSKFLGPRLSQLFTHEARAQRVGGPQDRVSLSQALAPPPAISDCPGSKLARLATQGGHILHSSHATKQLMQPAYELGSGQRVALENSGDLAI